MLLSTSSILFHQQTWGGSLRDEKLVLTPDSIHQDNCRDQDFTWIALFSCTGSHLVTGSHTSVTSINYLILSFVICKIVLGQKIKIKSPCVHTHTNLSEYSPKCLHCIHPPILKFDPYSFLYMQSCQGNQRNPILSLKLFLTLQEESCLIIKHKTSLFLYI